jgi:glycosyltransferase involved in cell wall biosynthesis
VVKRVAFAVPGDLATPTGGYAYDRRMMAELGELGWQIDLLDLGDGFPSPSDATRAAARTQLLAVPAGRTIVIDGLALGVLPEVASELAGRHPLLALVHHPLALESGLTAERAENLRRSERAALASVRGVIVTSAATAHLVVSDYGVPAERVSVARPGSDRAPPAPDGPDRRRDGAIRLLSVGTVMPRKGFDVLIAALATLADLPWRLTIAGDLTRDSDAAMRLEADIAHHGLRDRVVTLGAVSREHLAALYADADAFVLASHFEGYGMAYAEALAHGLPVIGSHAGAIPDTVPPDAGLLVPPGDVTAFARALRSVIADPELRQRLAHGARAAALRLPSWRQSAEIFSSVLERL